MRHPRRLAVAVTLALIVSATAAAAVPALVEGRYVLAPFAFTRFCIDYPAECLNEGGPTRVALTSQRMNELLDTNRRVNAAIAPQRDVSRLRLWALDAMAGDCNAYAVQKRHDLRALGWPSSVLSLAVVKTRRGEGHLVLVARTNAGDLVLDNLTAQILPSERAGYRWISRQSERNPQFWASLEAVSPTAPARADGVRRFRKCTNC